MKSLMQQTREAPRTKAEYRPGTRILLSNMSDPFAPVPSGTRGTVEYVDDAGQIHMKWDNGRSLALITGEDSFRKLTAEEIEQESEQLNEKMGMNIGM